MGAPVFFLQIVDAHGQVVTLPAGGALERDLVETIAKAVVAETSADFLGSAAIRQRFFDAFAALITQRSVGVFVPQRQVLAAVEEAMAQTLTRFMAQLNADVTPAVERAIVRVIADLKRGTRGLV